MDRRARPRGRSGGGSVSGEGLLDLVLVAEEMGRLVAPGPLLPVNVVADALARCGQRRAAGGGARRAGRRRRRIATWAFAEPAGAWDAAGVALIGARRTATAGCSRAPSRTCRTRASPTALLVTARTGEGLTQFLVPADTPGVTVRPLQSPRLHPPLRRLELRRRDGARRRPWWAGRRRRRTTSSASSRSRSCCRTPRPSARIDASSTSPSSTPRTASPSAAPSARTRR